MLNELSAILIEQGCSIKILIRFFVAEKIVLASLITVSIAKPQHLPIKVFSLPALYTIQNKIQTHAVHKVHQTLALYLKSSVVKFSMMKKCGDSIEYIGTFFSENLFSNSLVVWFLWLYNRFVYSYFDTLTQQNKCIFMVKNIVHFCHIVLLSGPLFVVTCCLILTFHVVT